MTGCQRWQLFSTRVQFLMRCNFFSARTQREVTTKSAGWLWPEVTRWCGRVQYHRIVSRTTFRALSNRRSRCSYSGSKYNFLWPYVLDVWIRPGLLQKVCRVRTSTMLFAWYSAANGHYYLSDLKQFFSIFHRFRGIFFKFSVHLIDPNPLGALRHLHAQRRNLVSWYSLSNRSLLTTWDT
jgi:hypothetical protein